MNSSNSLVEWLLDSFEVDTSLFHVGRYCGGWHASTHGVANASFHLIVQGQCWLHIDRDCTPILLNNGDALFLLQDFSYRLSGEATAAAAQECPRRAMLPLDAEATDGVGLVCGFFHFHSGLSAMIVDALPNWIILRAGDPSLLAARNLFELILQECQRRPAPSSALLERLCHLLFLYVLRQHVVDNAELGGLAALARQPAFAGLLEQLIATPAEPWTLESMAACTGLSRSAFFKRFHDLSGQSPGQVLLMMRMRHACQLFKNHHTVADASLAVGYQSVAAFTRAFHKVTGQQPGAYRRAQG
ncbi:helix-turn-helix domain-containing protein [Pseudomonas sp. CCM 7891]|uniref:Helix-turn-helix domain-containing protein n=1 Tax=Pseudomonas karstica TaxID=1055468 RepID=A0A7X2UW14_9PSED|nr:AraC family transcriptional regulator [Pseudomonas karstica]MTD18221.1 helix-turn-helix domain-containing protein [Pseudomonas karstica]